MKLRCHNAFGNFVPGDEVEVPDGAGFDHYYFEADEPEQAPEPAPEPEPDPEPEPQPAPEEEGK